MKVTIRTISMMMMTLMKMTTTMKMIIIIILVLKNLFNKDLLHTKHRILKMIKSKNRMKIIKKLTNRRKLFRQISNLILKLTNYAKLLLTNFFNYCLFEYPKILCAVPIRNEIILPI